MGRAADSARPASAATLTARKSSRHPMLAPRMTLVSRINQTSEQQARMLAPETTPVIQINRIPEQRARMLASPKSR